LKIIESYGGLSGIQLRHAERRLATTKQQMVGEILVEKGGWKSITLSFIPYRDS